MVTVRVSRVVAETLADEGSVAGATRLDVDVAGATGEANAEAAQVSRVVVEVLAAEVPTASATRLDVDVAGATSEANGGTVQASRLVVEVLAGEEREAAVTRLDVDVAGATDEANGAIVRVSRLVGEALARQGTAGPVVPLALNEDSEIFLHNWADNAQMTSAYFNDVRYSPVTGAESRRGLRIKPDRFLRLQWIVNEEARLDRLEVFLRRITDTRFQVPIYMDQVELSTAYGSGVSTIDMNTRRGRYFIGARVVIVQLDACNQYASHSFHTISDLTNSNLTFTAALGVAVPAGSLVMPVMDCEVLLDHETRWSAAKTAVVTLEVQEVAGSSALPPLKSDNPAGFPTLYGKPVFTFDPDWIQGMTRGRSRLGERYQQGKTELVFKAADRSRVTHDFLLTGDREEMWSLVEFFDTRRGRLRTFWLTDQERTFECAEIDASGNFVGIEELGNLADFNEEWDYVGIRFADGTEYVREVVTVQQVLTVFRLTVTPALPAGLDAAQVVRVARARPTRFETDELVENWFHTGYMSTRIRMVETLNERDAPIT